MRPSMMAVQLGCSCVLNAIAKPSYSALHAYAVITLHGLIGCAW